MPRAVKTAVRRPGTKEGGRREEEKRFGIEDGRARRPHNRKTILSFSPNAMLNCMLRNRCAVKVPLARSAERTPP